MVVLVLAGVLWYELESHALGPTGRREIVQVAAGESVDSVLAQLSADHVIGSTLAFQIFDLVHGSPSITPGTYALHQNQTFAQVKAILDGGPNIFAVTVMPGLSAEGGGRAGRRAAGARHRVSFAAVAASGVVHSLFSPPGSDNLEGMLGTGT